jgi:hypothetical protein
MAIFGCFLLRTSKPSQLWAGLLTHLADQVLKSTTGLEQSRFGSGMVGLVVPCNQLNLHPCNGKYVHNLEMRCFELHEICASINVVFVLEKI